MVKALIVVMRMWVWVAAGLRGEVRDACDRRRQKSKGSAEPPKVRPEKNIPETRRWRGLGHNL
jgi:hypothetical protein